MSEKLKYSRAENIFGPKFELSCPPDLGFLKAFAMSFYF